MKKILGIGNALVDVMTPIDDDAILERFALPKGSMQLVDGDKSKQVKDGTSGFKISLAAGGSAANTIHGLAMLGLPTGFIGSVGKDETGDFFEKDMKNAGVDTIIFRRSSPSGTAVALISGDGERTFATHLGAATELNADDLTDRHFRGYEIFYIEGYLIYNLPLVRQACSLARKTGMKVAIDLASYNVVEANLDSFREIINDYADIVFANEEEAFAFTGKAPEEAVRIISGSSRTAIVKTGKEGSIIKRGEELVKTGILPVNCVDTTGAGDLYASGFIYGFSLDLPLDMCGAIGALLAGRVREDYGAKISPRKWPAIRKSIEKITRN